MYPALISGRVGNSIDEINAMRRIQYEREKQPENSAPEVGIVVYIACTPFCHVSLISQI